MTLKKVTTRNVATIAPSATVHEAARLMRESHVGDVVVVEGGKPHGRPLGILTDRDIVVSTVAFNIQADKVSVEEVMQPSLTTAKATDSLYHVLTLMKSHGIKRVPVVGPDGALEGIISSDDIVALLAAELGDVARITTRAHDVELARRRRLASTTSL